MPLKKSPNGGGSNADGTISKMYCAHCYQQGKFTHPERTAAQMQDLVKGKLKEMGFPGFVAGWFTKRVPKLERWKSQHV